MSNFSKVKTNFKNISWMALFGSALSFSPGFAYSSPEILLSSQDGSLTFFSISAEKSVLIEVCNPELVFIDKREDCGSVVSFEFSYEEFKLRLAEIVENDNLGVLTNLTAQQRLSLKYLTSRDDTKKIQAIGNGLDEKIAKIKNKILQLKQAALAFDTDNSQKIIDEERELKELVAKKAALLDSQHDLDAFGSLVDQLLGFIENEKVIPISKKNTLKNGANWIFNLLSKFTEKYKKSEFVGSFPILKLIQNGSRRWGNCRLVERGGSSHLLSWKLDSFFLNYLDGKVIKTIDTNDQSMVIDSTDGFAQVFKTLIELIKAGHCNSSIGQERAVDDEIRQLYKKLNAGIRDFDNCKLVARGGTSNLFSWRAGSLFLLASGSMVNSSSDATNMSFVVDINKASGFWPLASSLYDLQQAGKCK